MNLDCDGITPTKVGNFNAVLQSTSSTEQSQKGVLLNKAAFYVILKAGAMNKSPKFVSHAFFINLEAKMTKKSG